jgi:protein O-GlcNAc transferase
LTVPPNNEIALLGAVDSRKLDARRPVLDRKACPTRYIMSNKAALDDAVRAYEQGRLNEAREINPNYLDAVINLAQLLEETGRPNDAIRLYEEGIRNVPRLEFYLNLGALYLTIARPDMAIGPLQAATTISPDCTKAIINLGMAYSALDRDADALVCYRRALELEPGNTEALKRLVALLEKLGRAGEAIRLIEQAPTECRTAEILLQLGNLLLVAGRKEEAAGAFREAVAARPDFAEAHFNLAVALLELHDANQARSSFARAAGLRPDQPLWRLRADLCDRVVWENAKEIDAYCARVERALVDFKARHVGEMSSTTPAMSTNPAGDVPSSVKIAPSTQAAASLSPVPLPVGEVSFGGTTLDSIAVAGVMPGISLSYHGRNQRRLKEQFSALYEPYFRSIAGHGPRDARTKVGFVVIQRHEELFFRCMNGILERLDPERFQIVLIGSPKLGAWSSAPRRTRFVPLDRSLERSIERVRAAECDVLYYWEIGSDPMNYFLPFPRLAHVQCTGWGSTLTTGIPAVDYFMTSELVGTRQRTHLAPRAGSSGHLEDRDEYAEQYTEKLWRSKSLFICEPRLRPISPAYPAYFGLPDDRRYFVCAQNPLKIHPDFDAMMAGILESDPGGLVVLVSDRFGHVARLLKERFARRIPNVADRIVFVPRQSFADYCRLLQLADVILDTLHFGAGMSCYDIFSFNLPVVTLPGELIIGQITQACYRKMGLDDLIAVSAEDYVAKAVQVATDRNYREYVTGRIAERSDMLFNDLEAVREHERFFEEALAEKA